MEINYQFRQRLSVVHEPRRRAPETNLKAGEIEIGSDWLITVPRDADAVLMNAARDLVDYFFVSMELSLHLIRDDEYRGGARIAYSVDPEIKERSYRVSVREGEILGEVIFTKNGEKIASLNLVAKNTVNEIKKKKGFFSNLIKDK